VKSAHGEEKTFRQLAIEEIDKVIWDPAWGKERITNMIATRPDWCISRQRTWGVPIPAFYDAKGEDILALAQHAPQAIVLVDEAYFHFFGETVADLIGRVPNIMLVRTFSKAYGLAGLRLGVLAGAEEHIRWVRRVLSPYSVNSLALACLPAALADEDYLHCYVSEVCAAREEFMRGLDGLGVKWWPSQANFVLTHIGSKHREFVHAMKQRGILVRDRSADPGCDGCVRVTVGTREQMDRALDAFAATLNEISWSK